MKIKIKQWNPKSKYSLLLAFVILMFFILLVSMVVSGIVSIFLLRLNIIPPVTESSQTLFIIVLLLSSLFMGTLLALIAGERFLRQIYNLAAATKEVAAGNFDVRINEGKTIEIDIISNSFNEMVKELSNIETLRADFVSNISHEFKTPVASIRGFARRLKKENLTDEQRDEYLDIIISESERLTRLSSSVLLLSSLESTEHLAEESEYSLDEQIRRTILLLEPQLKMKQLEIDVTLETVRIFASEEMLSHLWINILRNAIKFSHDGGVIKITLGTNDDEAVAVISDSGIGMDAEVKKHIFDKFYQGDKSRTTEGNGLGLSLVKRILELENGKIEVESEPGKGSCFTVILPKKELIITPKPHS